ncbi:two-component system sporulation sensor kinase A [Bacillus oleivorans]|uniref:histidine kinase n=1 Tax=Bacillus oleivorans TaxID=1448271 RepID=A0A285CT55_9BACI|nr:ATP-binding protein [Bacillus oleivorans]SNX70760.1 two-component system sporulation sensor kinase A [Bacillus oleivorans]
MNKSGQIILVMISILFTLYQKVIYGEKFFTFDFYMFTLIAWFVGCQYDRARHFGKKARASKNSYKQLLNSLPESVIIHSNNKILYVNDATVSMVRARSKEEIIGKSIFDFSVDEYKPRIEERNKQIKKMKMPLNCTEYQLKRFDGSTFYFEVSSLYIVFGEGEAILSIGKDITERKEQIDRMIQKSEKLALLGQMAAGVAHEIRNPLTSVKGFIQLLNTNDNKREYFGIVLDELERINAIVEEFLVLAKPSTAVFVEQDIRELIKDIITLVNNQLLLNNVQIFLDFDSDLPMVSCEKNQLKQVFLNLIKNAIEAMPKGGNINIRAKEKVNGKISISIEDEGIGIPEERIPTLGEPFYTTKEKGTGLGLMTCFKIIESHKGEILVHSILDKGTTVEILLPTITQKLLKHDLFHESV